MPAPAADGGLSGTGQPRGLGSGIRMAVVLVWTACSAAFTPVIRVLGSQQVPTVGHVCRPSVRPVLKHGPRSTAEAQVIGHYETQRRNESEGRLRRPRWDPLPSGGGAPLARISPIVDGAAHERVCCDPKDGELWLARMKPEETLVEVRSDSDVQIDRQSWL